MTKIPLLDNFCCCISLRNGGIILGSLSIAGAFWAAAFNCWFLYEWSDEKFMAYHKLMSFRRHPLWDEDDMAAHIFQLKFWTSLNVILAVLTIICASLLIEGAQKDRRYFVLPYLISEGLRGVSMVLFCFYQIYLAFDPPEEPGSEFETSVGAAVVAFGYFVGFLVQVYLWLCVYSLFQWIKAQQLRPQLPQQQPYAQQQPYNPAVNYSPVAKI